MKGNPNFEFEDIKLYKDHPLNNPNKKTISSVAEYYNHTLLGTLVEYPQDVKMLDVHYIKKYTANNQHASGWIKLETRRPQKGKTLISRLIDRSIRPLVKDKNFQLIISLIDNDSQVNPVKAILLLANELIFQAGYIKERALPYCKHWNEYYLVAISYQGGLIMLEASLNKMNSEDFTNHLLKAAELTEISKFKEKYLTKTKSPNSEAIRSLFPLLKRMFLNKELNLKLEINELLTSFEEKNWDVFNLVNEMLFIFCQRYGRIDGRDVEELREILIYPYILKSPSFSVLVDKINTKVLSSMIVSNEPQQVDESTSKNYKEFLNVQYDMLGHSVGQIARLTAHNRREVGHANLVFNGIQSHKIVNDIAVYIQNDVISCDGSSSMASLIGSSINLFLSKQSEEIVVGTSIGRIGDDLLISDISGIEDWLGNMDFKLIGNNDYLTAVQLDVKGKILERSKIKEVINRALSDLNIIHFKINEQLESIERKSLDSKFFVNNLKIKEEQIKFVIGYGGFNIKKVENDFNVKVNIEKQKNIVSIKGIEDDTKKAKKYFEDILVIPKIGDRFSATIVAIMENNILVQPDRAVSGFSNLNQKNSQINSLIQVEVIRIDKGKVEYSLIN